MSYKTLNLDLAKTPILKPIIYGRIGDEDMQTVTVNVTSRDTPVDLTGYTITFEGITNGGQTKVFDVGGIKATDLKKGSFTYTFPNMAFAVAGNYEIAYFSILKGKQRDTTGEFDIIVGNNADIDAAEAETIITEYNKLVQELHDITDKYISDSDAKFADLNQKIADLQTKITQYQNTVKNTADTAVSTINTTKDDAVNTVNAVTTNAVNTINAALNEFKKGDFYTKAETDSKLTDLENKSISNKGNLAIGNDLNDVTHTGFYRIGGFVGGTEILNVPEELTGVKFYGFVTVTEALQELTVYAPINSTTWTYSRSVSGVTPTWSSWSKAVMADKDGKVIVTRLETTSDVRTWTDIPLKNVTNAVLKYQIINGVIHLNGEGNWGSFTANQTKIIATLPTELRSAVTVNKTLSTQHTNNNDKPMEIQIQAGGDINIWSMPASTGGRYGAFEESYPLG